MCLQQHVQSQTVKDFERSVDHFQKGNREQPQLPENVMRSSIAKQSEQQTRRESVMQNRAMEEMKSGQTDETDLNRGRSKDDPGNENPDRDTHRNLPTQDRDECRWDHIHLYN